MTFSAFLEIYSKTTILMESKIRDSVDILSSKTKILNLWCPPKKLN